MPLYDPERAPDVAPEDAVAVVHDFLRRCRDWAVEREIPKRLHRVAEGQEPAEAAKLHEWIAWRRYVEHALQELEAGTLDSWFVPEATPPDSQT